MRKIFLLAIAAAMLGTALPAQAQYYGPGMMGGYGGGYMMGPGYGGHGPGYGPGMIYGYGPNGRAYGGGQAYRGKRLCWHDTANNTGYYEPCRK
jgi:hypothetical protein